MCQGLVRLLKHEGLSDEPLFPGADSIFADRRLVITVITLVVILPLCFPRELGALAWVSMAAVSVSPHPSPPFTRP